MDALVKRKRINFTQYSSGTHHDTFDYVIMSIMGDEITAQEIEDQKEFYAYYGAAPVCAWVLKAGLENEPAVANLIQPSHKVFPFKGFVKKDIDASRV